MARIQPLTAPFTKEITASLDKLVLPGMEPLKLFRTLAHNPRVLRRIQRGGLLDPGSISVRQRELMILRTCALCGARYEWEVHVAIFAEQAGLGAVELEALACDDPSSGSTITWTDDERALLALADALHESASVDEATWSRVSALFSPAQLIELITLAGLYHLVAFLVNALEVESESWAQAASPAGLAD